MQRMEGWDWDGTGLLGLPDKYLDVLIELFQEQDARTQSG
jgi:hypothetical protein